MMKHGNNLRQFQKVEIIFIKFSYIYIFLFLYKKRSLFENKEKIILNYIKIKV